MNILCFGDSQSDPKRTFEKASLLAKKQKFDGLLCLGDLLSEKVDDDYLNELLDDKIEVPIPTYFTCGPSGLSPKVKERAEGQSGQVCQNLYCLGSSGRLTLSAGAKIGFHTSVSADELRDFTHKRMPIVDILVTQQGPTLDGASALAAAVVCLPKYHFYNATDFFEALPYKSHMPNGESRLTREIALASVSNLHKSKWFYAFKLTRAENSSAPVLDARVNPYLPIEAMKSKPELEQQTSGSKQGLPEESSAPSKNSKEKVPPEGYVCKLCNVADEHYFKDCPNRTQSKKRKRGHEGFVTKHVDPSSCFFCLSNPDLARHLVVSIGNSETYLVLPKGGMTQNHVLILPVDHKATMKSLESSRASVETEMKQYVSALQKLYESVGMVGIVFEISRSSGVHFHQQMLPVPEEKVDDLIDAFYAFSETENIALETSQPEESEENFFRVQFPSRQIILTGKLNPKSKFDLQFGRRVVSDVMGVPERAHWKDCLRSDEQEAADADLFKEAFKPFDFTL